MARVGYAAPFATFNSCSSNAKAGLNRQLLGEPGCKILTPKRNKWSTASSRLTDGFLQPSLNASFLHYPDNTAAHKTGPDMSFDGDIKLYQQVHYKAHLGFLQIQ